MRSKALTPNSGEGFFTDMTDITKGNQAMRHAVTKKQQNSKMCLVCGLKNPYGLRASFYEMDNQELVALIRPRDEHQSYPGRLHGGLTTALLDETIGRAIMMKHPEVMWGVTVDFQTRFRKPVPLDVELRVIGRITSDNSRFFEGTGEILLPDGDIAATGYGKYIKLPLEKISDFDHEEQEWRVVSSASDPIEIDY
jgi:acyl-coenzyme A thioesterase PaaI-like protein